MMVGDDDYAPASHSLDHVCAKKKKKNGIYQKCCVEKRKMMTPPFRMGIWEE